MLVVWTGIPCEVLMKGNWLTFGVTDKTADQVDNAAQRPREQWVDMVVWLSLFVGPGFNLNTKSPSSMQWNVADEFE